MSEQIFNTALRPRDDTLPPGRDTRPAAGGGTGPLTPSVVAELVRLHQESERVSAQVDRPLALPKARRELKDTLEAELDALHTAGFSSFAEFSNAMHAAGSVEESPLPLPSRDVEAVRAEAPPGDEQQGDEQHANLQVLRDSADQVRESLACASTDADTQNAALTHAKL